MENDTFIYKYKAQNCNNFFESKSFRAIPHKEGEKAEMLLEWNYRIRSESEKSNDNIRFSENNFVIWKT